jgi:hypothetical protein
MCLKSRICILLVMDLIVEVLKNQLSKFTSFVSCVWEARKRRKTRSIWKLDSYQTDIPQSINGLYTPSSWVRIRFLPIYESTIRMCEVLYIYFSSFVSSHSCGISKSCYDRRVCVIKMSGCVIIDKDETGIRRKKNSLVLRQLYML